MTSLSNVYVASGKMYQETGFRSSSEIKVYEALQGIGIENPLYEKYRVPFTYTVNRHYIPDFVWPEKSMVIEVKGVFQPSDRKKFLL